MVPYSILKSGLGDGLFTSVLSKKSKNVLLVPKTETKCRIVHTVPSTTQRKGSHRSISSDQKRLQRHLVGYVRTRCACLVKHIWLFQHFSCPRGPRVNMYKLDIPQLRLDLKALKSCIYSRELLKASINYSDSNILPQMNNGNVTRHHRLQLFNHISIRYSIA